MSELFERIKAGDLCRVKQLTDRASLTVTNEAGMTPLEVSCLSGVPECTNVLLSAGADPNYRDRSGRTAMHVAASLRTEEARAHIRLLVQAGATVEARMNGTLSSLILKDWTPLMVAAAEGGITAVRALTDCGAQVNVTDAEGLTPLMLAVYFGCDPEEKAKALVGAGALVEAVSRCGKTALDFVVERSNLLTDAESSGVATQSLAALKRDYVNKLTALGVNVELFDATYPGLRIFDSGETGERMLGELARVSHFLSGSE